MCAYAHLITPSKAHREIKGTDVFKNGKDLIDNKSMKCHHWILPSLDW